MKTRIFALFSLAASFATPVFADTIHLVADEWCPFNCETGSATPGYMIEVAQKVFGAKGHTIRYEVVNWSRAIKMGEDGKVNGIIGAAKEDAPSFIYPEAPLGTSGDGLFVLKEKFWQFTNFDDVIKNKRIIGYVKDYGYNDELNAFLEKNPAYAQPMSGNDAQDRLIQQLLKGRISAYIEDPSVAAYILGQQKLSDKIVLAGEVKSKDPYVYIAFSPHASKKPKSQEYAKILSDGTEELRKNGELAKILAKYHVKDWK